MRYSNVRIDRVERESTDSFAAVDIAAAKVEEVFHDTGYYILRFTLPTQGGDCYRVQSSIAVDDPDMGYRSRKRIDEKKLLRAALRELLRLFDAGKRKLTVLSLPPCEAFKPVYAEALAAELSRANLDPGRERGKGEKHVATNAQG